MTGYDMHEFTSSGLTHNIDGFFYVASWLENYFVPGFWNVS